MRSYKSGKHHLTFMRDQISKPLTFTQLEPYSTKISYTVKKYYNIKKVYNCVIMIWRQESLFVNDQSISIINSMANFNSKTIALFNAFIVNNIIRIIGMPG